MSEQYFSEGKISRKGFERAIIAAQQQLRPVVNRFKRAGWDLEIGTSGTIKAISEIAHHQMGGGKVLTMEMLATLRDTLLQAEHIKELDFSSIKKERFPVLPGGLAILLAAFDSLALNSMNFSDGALREGVLFDLLGRLEYEDERVQTVQALERRYHIDFEQANRVELSACMLLNRVKQVWGLGHLEHQNILRWAARLHEIGLDIAHSNYHRHGAYLMQHADMPGFAWNEQRILACLVGCHRRKIRTSLFDDIQNDMHQKVKYLMILLRLSALLNRDRIDHDFPVKKLHAEKENIMIEFVPGWLNQSPLVRIDLEQENGYLQAIGFSLQCN